MDTEKKLAFDRLSFKEVGWIEVILMIMLGVIPFLSDRELDPFPGDKLWEELLSVIILIICEKMYYVIRELVKKKIYINIGTNYKIRPLFDCYGKADKTVSTRMYAVANLLAVLTPSVISGILLLFLPDMHFWKAYIVIMFALPELVGMCILLLRTGKVIKNKELIDEGRYVYVVR